MIVMGLIVIAVLVAGRCIKYDVALHDAELCSVRVECVRLCVKVSNIESTL